MTAPNATFADDGLSRVLSTFTACNLAELGKDFPGLPELVAANLERYGDAAEELSYVFNCCGSPIEKMMLAALMLFRRLDTRVECSRERVVWNSREWSPDDGLTVHVQKQIQNMRVDFLLVERIGGGDPGSVVVECDGHDWHERTKKQASSDRARDRVLQGLGHRVLRYTGSDIWRDVQDCALEALRHVEELSGRGHLAFLTRSGGRKANG